MVEVDGELYEAEYIVIPDSRVARGLIRDMHIVPLVNQTDKGTAHRYHIIVRVRRKDDGPFMGRLCPFGPLRIIGVGLAARPAGDRMLYLVKDVDIDIVYRPLLYG